MSTNYPFLNIFLVYGNLEPKLKWFFKPKLKPKMFLLNWVPEELHDRLADLDGLLVPPLGEEGDLGVHELPLGVLRQVAHHVVQDVLHLVLVVLLVRLDPARIAVGVRHDEDLELVLGPRDRLLVVRDRPPLLPHTAVCIVIR